MWRFKNEARNMTIISHRGVMVNSANITDKAVEALIKEAPGQAQFFERVEDPSPDFEGLKDNPKAEAAPQEPEAEKTKRKRTKAKND